MDELAALEERLSTLELRVLGHGELRTETKKKLVDELSALNGKLDEAVADREKSKKAFHELPKLEKLLDPKNADSLLPIDAKLQIIESSFPTLEERVRQMKVLEESLDALDSEHIQKAPSQRLKLAQLQTRQVEQMEKVSDRNAEVSSILHAYNELILNLNKQFAYWDAQLTKVEQKKQTSK